MMPEKPTNRWSQNNPSEISPAERLKDERANKELLKQKNELSKNLGNLSKAIKNTTSDINSEKWSPKKSAGMPMPSLMNDGVINAAKARKIKDRDNATGSGLAKEIQEIRKKEISNLDKLSSPINNMSLSSDRIAMASENLASSTEDIKSTVEDLSEEQKRQNERLDYIMTGFHSSSMRMAKTTLKATETITKVAGKYTAILGGKSLKVALKTAASPITVPTRATRYAYKETAGKIVDQNREAAGDIVGNFKKLAGIGLLGGPVGSMGVGLTAGMGSHAWRAVRGEKKIKDPSSGLIGKGIHKGVNLGVAGAGALVEKTNEMIKWLQNMPEKIEEERRSSEKDLKSERDYIDPGQEMHEATELLHGQTQLDIAMAARSGVDLKRVPITRKGVNRTIRNLNERAYKREEAEGKKKKGEQMPGFFKEIFSSVFGIKSVIGYALPFFGLGYRSELPNPSRIGILPAMFKVLSLIYVHSRFASDEINGLIFQQTRLMQEAFGIVGNLRRPRARSIGQWLGGALKNKLIEQLQKERANTEGQLGAFFKNKEIAGKFVDDFIEKQTDATFSSKGEPMADLLVDIREGIVGQFEWFKSNLTFRETGGEIKKTELSVLHPGERVLTKEENLALNNKNKSRVNPTEQKTEGDGFVGKGLGMMGAFGRFIAGILKGIFNFEKLSEAFNSVKVAILGMPSKIADLILGIKNEEGKREGGLWGILIKIKNDILNFPTRILFGKDGQGGLRGGLDSMFKNLGIDIKDLWEATEFSEEGGSTLNKKRGFASRFLLFLGDALKELQTGVYKKLTTDVDKNTTSIVKRILYAIQQILPDAIVEGLFGKDSEKGKGGILRAYINMASAVTNSMSKVTEGIQGFLNSFIEYKNAVMDAWKDPDKSVLGKILSPVIEIRKILFGLFDLIKGLFKGGMGLFMAGTETFGMEYKIGEMLKNTRQDFAKKILSDSFANIYNAIEDRIFEWGKAAFTSIINVIDAVVGNEEKGIKGTSERFSDRKKAGVGNIKNIWSVFTEIVMAGADPYIQFVKNLKSNIQSLWAGLKEYAGKDIVDESGTKIKKYTVTNLVSRIINDVVQSWRKILSFSTFIKEKMRDIYDYSVKGKIEPGPPKEQHAIGGWIGQGLKPGTPVDMTGHAGEAVLSQDGKYNASMFEPITTILKKHTDILEDHTKWLKEIAFRIGGKGDTSGQRSLLGAIVRLPFFMAEGMAKGFSGVAMGIGKAVGKALQIPLQLIHITLRGINASIYAVGKALGSALKFGFETLTTAVHAVRKTVGGLFAGLKAIITAPFKAIKNFIIKPWEKVKKGFGRLKDKLLGNEVIGVDAQGNPIKAKWPGKMIKLLKDIKTNTGITAKFYVKKMKGAREEEEQSRYSALWDKLKYVKDSIKERSKEGVGKLLGSFGGKIIGGLIAAAGTALMTTIAGSFLGGLAEKIGLPKSIGVGGGVGVVLGTVLGGIIGSIIPGWGTVAGMGVGAAIGAGVGAIGGAMYNLAQYAKELGIPEWMIKGGIGMVIGGSIGGILGSVVPGWGTAAGIGIGGLAGAAIGALGSGVVSLAQAISPYVPTFIKKGGVGGVIGATFGGLLGSVVPVVGTAMGIGIGGLIGGTLGMGGNTIKSSIGVIVNSILSTWDWFKNLTTLGVVGALIALPFGGPPAAFAGAWVGDKLGRWLFGDDQPTVGSVVSGVFSTAMVSIGKAWSWFKDLSKMGKLGAVLGLPFLGPIGSYIGAGIFTKIGSFLFGNVNEEGEREGGMMAPIMESIGRYWNWFGRLTKMGKFGAILGLMGGRTGSMIGAYLFSKLGFLLFGRGKEEGDTGIIGAAVDYFADFWTVFKTEMGNATMLGRSFGFIGMMLGGKSGMINSIKLGNWIQNGVGNFLSDVKETIMGGVYNFAGTISNFFGTIKNTIVDAVTNFATKFADFFGNLWETIKTAIWDLLPKPLQWAVEKTGDTANKVVDVASKATNWVGNKVSKTGNLASGAGEAIGEGVKWVASAPGKLWNWMTEGDEDFENMKYHTGGFVRGKAGQEVPAILKSGELVLTEDQIKMIPRSILSSIPGISKDIDFSHPDYDGPLPTAADVKRDLEFEKTKGNYSDVWTSPSDLANALSINKDELIKRIVAMTPLGWAINNWKEVDKELTFSIMDWVNRPMDGYRGTTGIVSDALYKVSDALSGITGRVGRSAQVGSEKGRATGSSLGKKIGGWFGDIGEKVGGWVGGNVGSTVGKAKGVASGVARSALGMPTSYDSELSPKFIEKVEQISGRLGINPADLMAAMEFESNLNPRAINRTSGASGLIQFMPSTARGLGTTIENIRRMSDMEQLDYVEKYFKPYKGKLNSLEDIYMAILWPKAVGKGSDYALFSAGSKAYNQNPLDWNKDGQVTKQEAAKRVTEIAQKRRGGGMKSGLDLSNQLRSSGRLQTISSIPTDSSPTGSSSRGSNTMSTSTGGYTGKSSNIYDTNKDTKSAEISGGVSMPTTSHHITSPWGPRNVSGGSSYHKAIDLRANTGDPIRAAMAGTITSVGGNYGAVVIDHGDGVATRYLHLSKFAVNQGDTVEAGQVIGHAGGTGPRGPRSYVPHLHFEVKKNNERYDPEHFLKTAGFKLSGLSNRDPGKFLEFSDKDAVGGGGGWLDAPPGEAVSSFGGQKPINFSSNMFKAPNETGKMNIDNSSLEMPGSKPVMNDISPPQTTKGRIVDTSVAQQTAINQPVLDKLSENGNKMVDATKTMGTGFVQSATHIIKVVERTFSQTMNQGNKKGIEDSETLDVLLANL